MRRARPLVFFLMLMAVAATGSAHPVPFSYLDLHLETSGAHPGVSGSLTVHVYDAAHELGVTPMERLLDPAVAGARAAALESMLQSRLALAADGRSLAITWGAVEVLAGKQSLRFPFTAGPEIPAQISLTATLFPYDPQHQTFVNVYEG